MKAAVTASIILFVAFSILLIGAISAKTIDVTNGKASDTITQVGLLITPAKPETKITGIKIGGTVCYTDKGAQAKGDGWFKYTLKEISDAGCGAYPKNKELPFYEMKIKTTEAVPFEYCQLTLDFSAVTLKPFGKHEGRMTLEIYRKGYRAQNTLKPKKLENALSTLKTLGNVPNVIVTYGKHEPGEPSRQLLKVKIGGKKIADYFGDDVLFVEIPREETPQGYYETFYKKVTGLMKSGKLGKLLEAKLRGLDKELQKTQNTQAAGKAFTSGFGKAEPAFIKKYRLTLAEAEELYKKANYPLPMSESEFTTELESIYRGCQTPFHIAIHYGTEKSAIYAHSELIGEHKKTFNLLNGIGIPGEDTDENREISQLAEYARKTTAKPDKQSIIYTQLIAPNQLGALLFKENRQRMINQDDLGKLAVTFELARDTKKTRPLADESTKGAVIRQAMFGAYPRFDHVFAIGASYLQVLDSAEAGNRIKEQAPKAAAALKIIYSEMAENWKQ